ncbi:hypothetical protein PCI56_15815 [Plesiomonas shigelloides subsp. oncorhynchi]|nr:hypothetical protein [Plesiomonas shigelloides]
MLSTPELDAKLNQAKAGEAAAGAVKQEVDNGARTQQIAAAKDVDESQSGGHVGRENLSARECVVP